jgi:hypothetical protein
MILILADCRAVIIQDTIELSILYFLFLVEIKIVDYESTVEPFVSEHSLSYSWTSYHSNIFLSEIFSFLVTNTIVIYIIICIYRSTKCGKRKWWENKSTPNLGSLTGKKVCEN